MNRTAASFKAIAILAMILLAPIASSQTPPGGLAWRTHFEAADEVSGASYALTEITLLPDESEDIRYVLVEDRASGDRLLIRESRDYLRHESTTEITDLATKETISATHPLPYKASSRSGVSAEIRANPELRNVKVKATTISTNGVRQTADEDEWMSKSVRNKRSALRSAATPQFLERLERLRVIVTPDSPLHMVCFGLLRYVLYNETCTTVGARVRIAQPDCTFDGTFKFPCSDKQKARIAKAKESGTKLESY